MYAFSRSSIQPCLKPPTLNVGVQVVLAVHENSRTFGATSFPVFWWSHFHQCVSISDYVNNSFNLCLVLVIFKCIFHSIFNSFIQNEQIFSFHIPKSVSFFNSVIVILLSDFLVVSNIFFLLKDVLKRIF